MKSKDKNEKESTCITVEDRCCRFNMIMSNIHTDVTDATNGTQSILSVIRHKTCIWVVNGAFFVASQTSGMPG